MDLSWRDFEHLVGEAFREQGFAVAETSDGADGGVDLELRRDGELHLVQCKRWRARSVGVEVMRELYGVMAARGAVGGYVVSSGRFSDEAKDFARGRDIDLWDGPKLKAEIRAAQPLPTSAAVARRTRRPEEPPACPTCGSEMVKRVVRRGSNAGKAFWGCSKYPNCRGTRTIQTHG